MAGRAPQWLIVANAGHGRNGFEACHCYLTWFWDIIIAVRICPAVDHGLRKRAAGASHQTAPNIIAHRQRKGLEVNPRKTFLVVLSALVSGWLMFAAVAWACGDPCLMVYPAGPVEYHYDTCEYYTVSFGHPLYNPIFDRGGKVLLKSSTNAVPLDIYQVPNLIAIIEATNRDTGFFFDGSILNLIVDGWNYRSTTYKNILLVFDPDPKTCHPVITVNGTPVPGKTYPLGDLLVHTPTRYGHNYSDTITVTVAWSGCYGVRIWAFADENYNGVKDGGECFAASSYDLTVPVEEKSWGSIKALYE